MEKYTGVRTEKLYTGVRTEKLYTGVRTENYTGMRTEKLDWSKDGETILVCRPAGSSK